MELKNEFPISHVRIVPPVEKEKSRRVLNWQFPDRNPGLTVRGVEVPRALVRYSLGGFHD